MYDSLRISLNLPIGTPEWMVYVIADAIARKNADAITKIVDPRQESIRENTRVAPANSTKVLFEKCWFQFKNRVYPDFLDKNVLDVGGGFGGIAPVLSNSASQIIVADPIFWENDIEESYKEDEKRILHRITLRNIFLEKNPHLSHIQADITEATIVKDEFDWWKTYDPVGKHRHIQRNPSYGEHLVWILSNSQDYIFVNYVLSKTTVHQIEFLEEMNRVLKTGWQIIISDYEMPQEVLSLLRSRFTDMSIIQNNGERFVGMGRKV